MKSDNLDIVGDKSIYDDSGKFCVSVDDKKTAWEQHYQRLSNEEFPWCEENLSSAQAVEGLAIHITLDMVRDATKKLKSGKASGPLTSLAS